MNRRLVSQLKCWIAYSPPGTGGVAARQENGAKPPLKAQMGWSLWTDHPVRASQRMPSAIFLDGTATPPVPVGEYPLHSSTSLLRNRYR